MTATARPLGKGRQRMWLRLYAANTHTNKRTQSHTHTPKHAHKSSVTYAHTYAPTRTRSTSAAQVGSRTRQGTTADERHREQQEPHGRRHRRVRRPRAELFGTYPARSAMPRIRALVASEISGSFRNALETVITETPALSAMSLRRIMRASRSSAVCAARSQKRNGPLGVPVGPFGGCAGWSPDRQPPVL